MTITYHREMIQGEQAWHDARCGLLTASEMRLIYRPPKVETRIKKNGEPYKQREATSAERDKEQAHLYELLAQRITRYVEPSYVGDAMLRGKEDEIDAIAAYAKAYAPVEHVGFVTNDRWGFTIGYSPDALVAKNGQVEAKSRNQKLQVRTLVEYVSEDEIDPAFMVQVQTGLLVTCREWCDLISYSGGLPMATVRVYPDIPMMEAIIDAAESFEARLLTAQAKYNLALTSDARLIPTERKIIQEMFVGVRDPDAAFYGEQA